MNNNWQVIEGDNNLLSFDGDKIFKVGNYKQDLIDKWRERIKSHFGYGKYDLSSLKYQQDYLRGQLDDISWYSFTVECDFFSSGNRLAKRKT